VGLFCFLDWLTLEMAANSANRPFGRKSVAAAVEPAKIQSGKSQQRPQARAGCFKKGIGAAGFFFGLFLVWGYPAISMDFLRGNSIPIGAGQCSERSVIKRAHNQSWSIAKPRNSADVTAGHKVDQVLGRELRVVGRVSWMIENWSTRHHV
jgi:hypothetical protein